MINEKPLTPLLAWLCEQQGDITGRELAEISGIAPQTWSKVRQGKQDLSSDVLWRVMNAIAILRPASDCARVVAMVEGRNFRQPRLTIGEQLSNLIEVAEESELESAMVLITQIMFRKIKDISSKIPENRIKSPIPY